MSESTAAQGGSYLLSESVITLNEVARRADTNIGAVYRWVHTGLRGGIRLEACLRGARWVSSTEALDRFFDRLTAAGRGDPIDSGPGVVPHARTASERRRQSEAAGKLAEQLGA